MVSGCSHTVFIIGIKSFAKVFENLTNHFRYREFLEAEFFRIATAYYFAYAYTLGRGYLEMISLSALRYPQLLLHGGFQMGGYAF